MGNKVIDWRTQHSAQLSLGTQHTTGPTPLSLWLSLAHLDGPHLAYRIKCFLPLNHIMHLAEALLRFPLWGIVCVKPTELKVLLHLLFPTPGRQSCCRAFCILAAKRWKVRWRQKVQGLATLSFGTGKD